MVPLANNCILLGRSIWSHKDLEQKKVSTTSDFIHRVRRVQHCQRRSSRSRRRGTTVLSVDTWYVCELLKHFFPDREESVTYNWLAWAVVRHGSITNTDCILHIIGLTQFGLVGVLRRKMKVLRTRIQILVLETFILLLETFILLLKTFILLLETFILVLKTFILVLETFILVLQLAEKYTKSLL